MRFDFGTAIMKTEDFLRRHIKPKAVTEAEKRRSQRKMQQAGRRVKRAFLAGGMSGAGLGAASAAIVSLGPAAPIVVGVGALVAAGAALLWPIGDPSGISREELAKLVADAEDWLIEQRTKLPGRVLPAFDPLFIRLGDLHPRVAEVDPHATLAWELRRLLGDHLPRLVHSYVELPLTVRNEDETLIPRLAEGLSTVDEELARICRELARDHRLTFEAQERFLDSRYRDDSRLRGD